MVGSLGLFYDINDKSFDFIVLYLFLFFVILDKGSRGVKCLGRRLIVVNSRK